jgi:hypothetical protein
MKKYIYIALFIIVLLSVICIQYRRINILKEDCDVYRQNTHALLSDIERYRVINSLHVASIEELYLTINEYKKYRQEDMRLIESLRVDGSRLQQVISTQMQTIYELRGTFRDSIVYRDHYVVDTIRCIDIADRWFDFSGCVDKNSQFTGRFENRDSLLYIEHIVPKRFWFIRWGVKERRQEIVSRNPHTRIVGAEFVVIRK